MALLMRNVLVLLLAASLSWSYFVYAADTPEDVFWKSVKRGDAIEEYRAYLESFPKGKYVDQARAAIEAMEAAKIPPDPAETAFWADVKANKQKPYYVAYLEQFPRGRHVAEAKRALAQFEADERQEQARSDQQRRASATKTAADAKLAAEQAEKEKVRIELVDWESTKAMNTWLGYAEFIKKHPDSRLVTLAKLAQSKLPEPAELFRPGKVFKDCAECPEMVVISGRMAVGRTELTQRQWEAFMGSNPSKFKGCADCPVEQVSWNDAQEYIRKLSKNTGKSYRLPSEEEWERACRAGGQQAYCGSENVDSLAWYSKNSGNKTRPVGGKQPNAWGLYDMSGNVWEWTDSCWEGDCGRRVLRGGSWSDIPQSARAANRSVGGSANRYDDGGFRPARMLP